MFLTRRLRLALLVSLGPTPTTLDLDASAGATGALFLVPVPLLAAAPSWARAPPLGFPSLLVAVVPPLPQPVSNRADRAPRTIRLLAGRMCRGDSRWMNAGFMADLRGTSGERIVCPLERRTLVFVPCRRVSVRLRGDSSRVGLHLRLPVRALIRVV